MTGLIYCNTIAFCQGAFELRRAREWTDALDQWCQRQPEMVAHTGVCLVHRAEILELAGDWDVALREARRAGERFRQRPGDAFAAGQAAYREGELHRLRGELVPAEEAYRDASRCGWEPQPGLALLRLAQGRDDAAAAAIRRALSETSDPLQRLRLLPACVEILLAVGAGEDARTASAEIEQIAGGDEQGVAGALAAHAAGAVDLAVGDAGAALAALRRACRAWQELGVPYEAARARMLVGLACRQGRRRGLRRARARGRAGRVRHARRRARTRTAPPRCAVAGATHGLSPRQLEVLRLVAMGKSNREIAAELVISEHTVARHVQNILTKLRLRSRTAAGAFAFEHHLVVRNDHTAR